MGHLSGLQPPSALPELLSMLRLITWATEAPTEHSLEPRLQMQMSSVIDAPVTPVAAL
jgi:hypothetical protein